MGILLKGLRSLAFAAGLAGITLAACTSGGGGVDEKFAAALSELNKDWQLYEVKKEGDRTVIKVEVSENVTFQQGETAKEALQKIDPALTGYIEFYNSEVGMTLRKVEIFPAT